MARDKGLNGVSGVAIGSAVKEDAQDAVKLREMMEQRRVILENIQGRLDHPMGRIEDQNQRNRMVVEMLSGATFAFVAINHPLAVHFLKLTNHASQVGEDAIKPEEKPKLPGLTGFGRTE